MNAFLPALLSLPLLVIAVGCATDPVTGTLVIELVVPELPAAGVGVACGAPAECAGELECVDATCQARAFVRIQARHAADDPFEDPWGTLDADEFQRQSSMDRREALRYVTDEIEQDVNVRIGFCLAEACTAITDAEPPESWFTIERPFYRGQETMVELRPRPEDRSSSPALIERCSVRGCVDGELSSYCRVDGRHLCEEPPPEGIRSDGPPPPPDRRL